LLASIDITAHVQGAPEASLPRHAAVVESIRLRDAHAAEEAMRTLIATTARDIERGLHLTQVRAEDRP
jgi:DNA-binding FadR family transcriptional regulator